MPQDSLQLLVSFCSALSALTFNYTPRTLRKCPADCVISVSAKHIDYFKESIYYVPLKESVLHVCHVSLSSCQSCTLQPSYQLFHWVKAILFYNLKHSYLTILEHFVGTIEAIISLKQVSTLTHKPLRHEHFACLFSEEARYSTLWVAVSA